MVREPLRQRVVVPVPWNLIPPYFQGSQRVTSRPPPQAWLSEFALDPTPVENVPKAPVSNSLALKNPDGGETTGIEDVTGCPPKAAIPREVNITMAKAVSLFIFAFLHPCYDGSANWTNRRCKGFLQGGRVKLRVR
jgi:hypothetical protein